MSTTAPINTIILKVASPCNLNCSYCYEYNRGDTSWKLKPASVSRERCELVGKRIQEYCSSIDSSEFRINLHGGEPMLVGPRRIAETIDTIRKAAAPVHIRFGMQTNGTLTSPEMVAILAARRVNVGVSLDGDTFSNRNRVDHKGQETRDATVQGIALLRKARIFAGIQAVLDLESEPEAVLDSLCEFDPPMLELTIPFGNHDNPPATLPKRYALGDWLCRAFDHWVNTPALSGIRVRLLQDALEAVIGERSASEWFPAAPPGYIVVATDGAYEGLDTLKVVGGEGRILDLNVQDAPIAAALSHPSIVLRAGPEQLCDECRQCAIVNWCNGGYFPTRYGLGRGFRNPSVYCVDLKQFFSHIANWVLSHSEVPDSIRNRISQRLKELDAAVTTVIGRIQ
jgi:sulfatase maturation enzyme AslB (radical SAM superfamily)